MIFFVPCLPSCLSKKSSCFCKKMSCLLKKKLRALWKKFVPLKKVCAKWLGGLLDQDQIIQCRVLIRWVTRWLLYWLNYLDINHVYTLIVQRLKPLLSDKDGNWTNWTDWTPCKRTCGYEVQNRTRECVGRAGNGNECAGSTVEEQPCGHPYCEGIIFVIPSVPSGTTKKVERLNCSEWDKIR